MDFKTGWKTTEFWLSVIAFICGVLVASGVLPTTHWAVKIAGAVLAGLGALGYSIGRGIAKGGQGSAPPTAALLPFLFAGLLLCSGCASWQQAAKTSLDAAGAAAEGLTPAVMAHYVTRCEAAARTCGCKPPLESACPCPQLYTCQGDRDKAVLGLKAVHSARYAGYVAIAAADRAKTDTVVAQLVKLAAELSALLRTLGVM